jgi:hypothetical protein
LPLPKSEIKQWGFKYASDTYRFYRKLKYYQQDAALCYTRFQPMTAEQWEAIRTDSIDNLRWYYEEVINKGLKGLPSLNTPTVKGVKDLSSLDLPTEFKLIIDSFRNDYESEVKELRRYVRSSNKSTVGCLLTAFSLITIGFVLTWILILL